MTPRTTRPKVLSIVGPGRGGSTIVSRILDATDGVFSAGELRWLWSRDLLEQRLCGCGDPPAQCPIWSAVVEATLEIPAAEQRGDRLARAVADVVAAQEYAGARRNRHRVLTGPTDRRPPPPRLALLIDHTVSLLDAVFSATGARVVVDSSKRPSEAAVVAASGRFDHYVLHLVRDPRAVVHSWSRAKPLPVETGRTAMASRSRLKTVLLWNENALGAEYLQRKIDPDRWFFMRYEDFAESPRAMMTRLTTFLGEQMEAPFVSDDEIVLGVNHNLSGNPDRFNSGQVRITPDQKWQSRMPRHQQFWVQAATLPLMRRYGYPVVQSS